MAKKPNTPKDNTDAMRKGISPVTGKSSESSGRPQKSDTTGKPSDKTEGKR